MRSSNTAGVSPSALADAEAAHLKRREKEIKDEAAAYKKKVKSALPKIRSAAEKYNKLAVKRKEQEQKIKYFAQPKKKAKLTEKLNRINAELKLLGRDWLMLDSFILTHAIQSGDGETVKQYLAEHKDHLEDTINMILATPAEDTPISLASRLANQSDDHLEVLFRVCMAKYTSEVELLNTAMDAKDFVKVAFDKITCAIIYSQNPTIFARAMDLVVAKKLEFTASPEALMLSMYFAITHGNKANIEACIQRMDMAFLKSLTIKLANNPNNLFRGENNVVVLQELQRLGIDCFDAYMDAIRLHLHPVAKMLTLSGKTDLLNRQGIDGITPLMLAVIVGNVDIFKLLLLNPLVKHTSVRDDAGYTAENHSQANPQIQREFAAAVETHKQVVAEELRKRSMQPAPQHTQANPSAMFSAPRAGSPAAAAATGSPVLAPRTTAAPRTPSPAAPAMSKTPSPVQRR